MSFDTNDPADLLALKTEVNTDPLTLGYDPVGPTQDILDLLNAKNFTVSKPKISPAGVRTAATFDAYNTLSIDEQEWIRWVTGSNGVEEDNLLVTTDLRLQLTSTDPAGNEQNGGADSIWNVSNRAAMNSAMLALIVVPGSRAEVLFGFDTAISRNDWLAARDS